MIQLNKLSPSVQAALKQLGIHHVHQLQEKGAVRTFLLLKSQGLTITRSVLWQLAAIEQNLPLTAIDAPARQALQAALDNHPPVSVFPDDATMSALMQEALRDAHTAAQQGEVPVGAVIVKEGKIIARAYNRCIGERFIGAHAEMRALFQAAQLLDNYRLDGCDIYITLEPCAMCASAIIQARVARLIFALPEPKSGAAGSVVNLFTLRQLNSHTAVHSGVLAAESRQLLQQFFAQKRHNTGEEYKI